MRILVVAASHSMEISGIQRHALNLVRCLLCRPEISKVELAIAPWQTGMVQSAGYSPHPRVATHAVPMGRGSLRRNSWLYQELPALADRLDPDAIHFTYPVPIDAASLTCPTAVTLHDLYPYEIPGNFRFPHVIFNRLILRHCLQHVSAIACVSNATKAALQRYAPHSTWRKAVVIHNCVEPLPAAMEQAPNGRWTSDPFLLSVAQHRKNKNLPLLIQTFQRLLRGSQIDPRFKLLIVGIEGPETRRIHRLMRHPELKDSVILLRGLSDSELQWCYGRCHALVLPSKTEGFGLPLAEGLLKGCNIVAADISAFRELGDSHCRYVALGKESVDGLAREIQDALRDPQRKSIALPHLSAEFLGARYVDLYQALVRLGPAAKDFDRGAPVFAGPLYDAQRRPRFVGREE